MAQESEHLAGPPEFNDASSEDQPGMPPPAGAPEATGPTRDEPTAAVTQRQPGPSSAPPRRKADPAAMAGEARQPSRSSLLSSALMMVVGAGIGVGTFFLGRAYAPPRPPGETAGPPAADAVKPDDFKKVADRVDHMAADVDQAKKQIADRPDYSNQVKVLNDRINELQQTVAQLTPQFDSINQKLGTLGKVEDANSSGQVDALSKRVDDLSHAIDSLNVHRAPNPRAGAPAAPAAGDAGNVQVLSMDQAVELFNAKKYAEARDAFTKLQTASPNDARVWYYSALATGWGTGKWADDADRLAKVGLEKEKAGQPASDQVDAAFAGLAAGSKDWLAAYRKRIGH